MAKSSLLTNPQINTLNNVLIAAGQITAGSIVVPFLFPSVDKTPSSVLLFGLMSTFILWITPILLSRKIKKL